jgi:hypothetical protein
MAQERFEAWDEQSLDPENMPPARDQSSSRHPVQEDVAQADGTADRDEKPARTGRKPRKSRARARAGGAKADQQDASSGDVDELEAQGFTHDEAIHLIHVSDRLANSREAREAEAAMRRLRFTRWLVERGLLDEWSA